MNIFALPGIETTASALTAEGYRMDIIGQNLAGAGVARGLDGKVYQRQQVVFENILQNQTGFGNSAAGAKMVTVARVEKDNSPPRMIPQPGHPLADASGMVAYPNVNIHTEMADMIVASRAYEANLAVVKNARQLSLQTLSIGKK